MPPRLRLEISSPRSTAPPAQATPTDANASIDVTDNGSLKVFRRSQEYNFTKQGLVRHGGRQHALLEQQSYKISDKDVRILKTLGHGASSVVHKAYYAKGRKFVAIKKINCFEKDKRHQMMNDVKALCDEHCPGLVRFIGAYHAPENGQIAIVLEYMACGSLGDLVQMRGALEEQLLSHVTRQVLRGLAHLHRGKHLVHRDIKPANILLAADGTAKIADFGISAWVDNTLAVCQTFLGTVTYMSPERINGEPYSFPADIWSLGLTLAECATGRFPYDASAGPLQLMIQVVQEPAPVPGPCAASVELRDFVGRCLAKDPLQRPTADALLGHPFIARVRPPKTPVVVHTNSAQGVRSFLAGLGSPLERLEDVAFQVVAGRYAALEAGGPAAAVEVQAAYTPSSVLVFEGAAVRGGVAIAARWAALAGLDTEGATVCAETLDVQALDDGSDKVLAHVVGCIQCRGAARRFAEAFVVAAPTDERPTIRRQIFRFLA